MPLKLVQGGSLELLQFLISQWGTLVMGIFVADYTPQPTDSLGTYTAMEATWTGYVRANITGWSTPTLNGTGHAESDAGTVLFPNVSGGAQTAYGYFLMDSSQTSLLWAERDGSAPVTIPDGQSYQITPQFTLISEF